MYKLDDIDIADCKRVNGYVHYLIALQNLDPICLDAPIHKAHKPLIDEMTRVCELIEDYLPKCEAHNLRTYASNYAMLYLFAKLKRLDASITDELDLRILESWMHGNTQISEIEAYSIVGRHLNEVQTYLKRWYHRKRNEYLWSIENGDTFANLIPVERYHLLNELWVDGKLRRSIHSKVSDAVRYQSDDFRMLDTETLCEYYHFQGNYAWTKLSLPVKMRQEIAILEELSSRHDLDKYDRLGYALDKQAIEEFLAEELSEATSRATKFNTAIISHHHLRLA